jgi:hypothetical protein
LHAALAECAVDESLEDVWVPGAVLLVFVAGAVAAAVQDPLGRAGSSSCMVNTSTATSGWRSLMDLVAVAFALWLERGLDAFCLRSYLDRWMAALPVTRLE